MTTTQPQRIAALNDEFRQQVPGTTIPGRMLATRGISALPMAAQLLIWALVGTYKDFNEDNDPHGEHDFGAFEETGGAGRVFWKIDYYADSSMQWGSEAPEDPARSYRVLTVMLASEY